MTILTWPEKDKNIPKKLESHLYGAKGRLENLKNMVEAMAKKVVVSLGASLFKMKEKSMV